MGWILAQSMIIELLVDLLYYLLYLYRKTYLKELGQEVMALVPGSRGLGFDSRHVYKPWTSSEYTASQSVPSSNEYQVERKLVLLESLHTTAENCSTCSKERWNCEKVSSNTWGNWCKSVESTQKIINIHLYFICYLSQPYPGFLERTILHQGHDS